jgi:hypothetical protein
MRKKYVKGDREKVLTRIDQVSDITVNVPTSEKCMDYLYDSLMILCYHYADENNGDLFLKIPYLDFYNAVLFSNKCCKEKDINSEYIFTMMNIVRTFSNLKYVTVVFNDNDELMDAYERLINLDSNECTKEDIYELTNVYSINALEIYLSDMFDQEIIDFINKHFIYNGIISNSYLERDFLITFEFEEYISYINMLIENNIDRLSMYDENIADYLRVFPSIIGDTAKPDIRLYTNYREI